MRNALQKLKKAYRKLFVKEHIILLIGFIALTLPYFFRGFSLHGQESYFYYRISNLILGENIPSYDFLSFGGRAFLYSIGSPLTLALIKLLSGISIETLLVFLPLIFGFLSLLLFYHILKYFKLRKNTLSFSCYLLILSPAFLYSFVHLTSFAIPLFLNLLGFYLVINKKKLYPYLAFLVYLMLSFFEFIHVLFGLLLIFFYFYKIKELKRFIPYSFIILLTLYLNNHFIKFGLDIINKKIYGYLFIFGGEYGLSIFLLFLAFFGLMYLWRRKYENIVYYLFFVINLFILVLNIKYLIYISLILSILAAHGLKYIYKLRWNSLLIRDITVIILLGGVISSGISFLAGNSHQDPNDKIYNALLLLREKTNPRDAVLSHEKYGIYINSIANRKNFVDVNKAYAPRAELRYYYLNKIFHSRDLTNTLKVFNEFRITHILITPEMKNGLVWNTKNEGLLYLLNKNPQYFKLIYNQGCIEVWELT